MISGQQLTTDRRLRLYLRLSIWVRMVVGCLAGILILLSAIAFAHPVICFLAVVPVVVVASALLARTRFNARLDGLNRREGEPKI